MKYLPGHEAADRSAHGGPTNKVNVHVHIGVEDYDRLCAAAVAMMLPRSVLIRTAIEQYLARLPASPNATPPPEVDDAFPWNGS